MEEHTSKKAVIRYMAELAQAVEDISNNTVAYQQIEGSKGIRRYKINKHTDLYYKEVTHTKIVLLTIFDTRQDPGKLKL